MIISGDEDKPGSIWHGRCSEYWIRQGQLYGFEPSDIAISTIVDPVVGPCVTTWCVVKKLLPGRRERRVVDEHERH